MSKQNVPTYQVAHLAFSGVSSKALRLKPKQGPRYVERLLRGGDYIKTDDGSWVRPASVTHFWLSRHESH